MKRTIYLAVITVITIACVLYGVNEWYYGDDIQNQGDSAAISGG